MEYNDGTTITVIGVPIEKPYDQYIPPEEPHQPDYPVMEQHPDGTLVIYDCGFKYSFPPLNNLEKEEKTSSKL